MHIVYMSLGILSFVTHKRSKEILMIKPTLKLAFFPQFSKCGGFFFPHTTIVILLSCIFPRCDYFPRFTAGVQHLQKLSEAVLVWKKKPNCIKQM